MALTLLILAIAAGFYVAWNIGANDVANAVGTSVGSGALTLKQAVLVAAIFEFCGAFFLGGSVSETVESGIIKSSFFSHDQMDYVFGMLASLLAAGVWLQIASYFGWPVSTTHSIIGAVVGFGLVLGGGLQAINWWEIGSIALSWIISPLIGGGVSYLIFSIIRRKILYNIHPINAAKIITPYLVFFVFFILTTTILFGGLSHIDYPLNILESIGIAVLVGLITAWIAYFLLKRIVLSPSSMPAYGQEVESGLMKVQKHLQRVEAASMGSLQEKVHDILQEVEEISSEIEPPEEEPSEYGVVEKIFVYLQIVVACFMALAHGSNDVANAIGPLSAIVNILQGRPISDQTVSFWLLLLGGVGIVLGLATWGWRVIETVGRKITDLTPSRGFSAGFGAALTILVASKLGLPISTTHVLVGAVLGVGFARGIGAINLNTIRDIAISWIVTVPAGATLSILFFYILRLLFS
ncbi:MAG: Low-affinity inorganic phosphate transporter 1 [Chlamydiae bacterium]|nr:Low-affinity inorganic phosphate transporter 1 [Chlamydiota bacterium]